ncbi:hypothetical protein D9M71_546510 [compost metagenome]
MGVGPVFIGGATASQPRQPAAFDPGHYRGYPVHRNHLPLAVGRDARCPGGGIVGDRLCHRAGPGQRARRPGLRCRSVVQPATFAQAHAPGGMAGVQSDPDSFAGGTGRWLAVPRVLDQACDYRHFGPEHLQPAVHHARRAVALAPAQLSRRSDAGGTDHHWGADPVPAVRLDRSNPDHSQRQRCPDPGPPHLDVFRADCFPRHLCGVDGRVLGGTGFLHPVGWRQVDHRGAVCDAGGQ